MKRFPATSECRIRSSVAALVTLSLVLLAGAPATSWARGESRSAPREQAPVRSEFTRAGMSLDDAIQMVKQRYRARVLKAETRDENGRTVYHLLVVNDDGKVWTVRVDAQSGSVR